MVVPLISTTSVAAAAAAAAAAVLLAGLGSAHQGPGPGHGQWHGQRQPAVVAARAAPTDVWVSVDDSGASAKTITPILSTASGTATIISGAPYDVTGTVFTTTYYAVVTTSTGTAPATAVNTAGAGAFALCHNLNGPVAPFCAPADNGTVYVGTTYYVTWDMTYFPRNATIELRGLFLDAMTGEPTNQSALASSGMPAVRGFYPWTIDNSMPVATGDVGANVSLQIRLLSTAAAAAPADSPGAWRSGPRVLVAFAPTYRRPNSPAPTGKALYIGLPTMFGFVVLCVLGTWLWNRKTHRIALGSVMGRRRGYGVAKSRAQRLGLKRKDGGGAIQLQDRSPPSSVSGPEYRDEPHGRTPSEEPFAQQPVRGVSRGVNVFREELQRHDRNYTDHDET